MADTPVPAVRVPLSRAEAEVRERGSRFVATVAPARSEAAAKRFRDEVRAEFHGATHHVWAFRGADGLERWDDDGEPAGTAGRPILSAIRSSGLSDTVVVVTRWFGGTKLGTGGLARAYCAVSDEALRRVTPAELKLCNVVHIRYDWPDTGVVAAAIEAIGARRLSERFDSGPELEVEAPVSASGALVAAVREATSGRAECRIEDRTVWVRDKG